VNTFEPFASRHFHRKHPAQPRDDCTRRLAKGRRGSCSQAKSPSLSIVAQPSDGEGGSCVVSELWSIRVGICDRPTAGERASCLAAVRHCRPADLKRDGEREPTARTYCSREEGRPPTCRAARQQVSSHAHMAALPHAYKGARPSSAVAAASLAAGL
jgi:hypothetical protein